MKIDISDNKTSFRASIARASVSIFTNLPRLNGDKGLETSAKVARKLHFWRTPKNCKLTKYDLDGLPVEVLETVNGNTNKVILQFHGGCYYIGFNDLYRKMALQYSKVSQGATIVSIDYRTAPEATFPAALEDALKTWDWLLQQGYKEENIIVAGDSAGGNLALTLGLTLRDQNRKLPKAFILMSPWTDMARNGESYKTNVLKDPMFGGKVSKAETMTLIWSYMGDHDPYDPYLSPAYGEYHDFPPMLIQVGTYEVLESDSETVYNKAKAANVDVTLTKFVGMFHVFQLAGNIIPESKYAWEEVKEFVLKHFY